MASWQDHYDECIDYYEHPDAETMANRRAVARSYADTATGPQDDYGFMQAAADTPVMIYVAFGLLALLAVNHGHLPPALDLAIYRLSLFLHSLGQNVSLGAP